MDYFFTPFFFGSIILGILLIIAQWIVYQKAGKPGWACIIPIYNLIVLLEIVGKPLWWLLLMLIPVVNIITAIIVYHNLSQSFGKTAGFTVGLVLLPFIFFPILAFGEDKYLGTGKQTPSNLV